MYIYKINEKICTYSCKMSIYRYVHIRYTINRSKGGKNMKQITNTRKAVCTMANELRKSGYSLSQAFRKAWRRIKVSMKIRVVGTTSGNIQERLKFMKQFLHCRMPCKRRQNVRPVSSCLSAHGHRKKRFFMIHINT